MDCDRDVTLRMTRVEAKIAARYLEERARELYALAHDVAQSGREHARAEAAMTRIDARYLWAAGHVLRNGITRAEKKRSRI